MRTILFPVLAASLLFAPYSRAESEGVIPNPDGSVTVLRPQFRVGGELRGVSSFSSATGLCRLLGYDRDVDASLLFVEDHRGMALVLDPNGKVRSYDEGARETVERVLCVPRAPKVFPSTEYASLLKNDDGSIGIVRPAFNAFPLFVGASSDGICSLYGLGESIGKWTMEVENTPYAVGIDKRGAFSGFEGTHERLPSALALDTVVCATNATTPATRNYEKRVDHPDGASTLTFPKVRLGETDLYLWLQSDLDGVCRRYGFKGASAARRELSRVFSDDIFLDTRTLPKAALGADSKVSGIYDFRKGLSGTGRVDASIALLECDSGKSAPSRDAKGIFKQDDGTTLVLEPARDGIRFSDRYSDLDGVCRHYGFAAAVARSAAIDVGVVGRLVAVDRAGRFAGYTKANAERTALKSIRCQ